MKLTHDELLKNGFRLVFSDDFDGDKLNSAIWHIMDMKQQGHSGREAWRKPENITVKDSLMTITARIEKDGRYTSGMINTGKSLCYKYGYAEIRAKLPIGGSGIWPGFWMKSDYKGAKVNSEIDVFEMFGNDRTISCNLHAWWRDRNYNNVHHLNYLDGSGYTKEKTLDGAAKYSDDFHTIGYYWTPEFVEFAVDGESYCHVDITNPALASFHTPIYFIISMAYGLPHIPAPQENRTEPIEYIIDYIRLYQDDTGELYDMDEETNIIKREK